MKNSNIKERILSIAGNIIFLISLISPILAFIMASTIGEVEIFNEGGIVRYSWIAWLFIPFSVISFFLGKSLQKNNKRYKKNKIIAYIMVPFLAFFGSYRFIYASVHDYSTSIISRIEQEINIDLPNNIKIVTLLIDEDEQDVYEESYSKITNKQEKLEFDNSISKSSRWLKVLDSALGNALPDERTFYLNDFDYFMFFNYTTGEFNSYPQYSGNYDYLFIAYDIDLSRLTILNHYGLSVVN